MAEKIDFEPIDFEPEAEAVEMEPIEFEEESTTPYYNNPAANLRDLLSSSKAEAVAGGAASGATLGLADELAASIGAPIEKLADLFPTEQNRKLAELEDQGFKFPQETLLDTYRRQRDTIRGRQDELRAEEPGLYNTSELTGGLASSVLLPGAAAAKGATTLAKYGRFAGTGAAAGAAAGAGTSEADLTEGEVKDFASDVGESAVLGGAIGTGLPAAGTLAAKGAKAVASGVGKGVKGTTKAAMRVLGMDDAISLGEEAYDAGKMFSKEEMSDIATQKAEKLYSELRNNFSATMEQKKAIEQMAEEAKKRINAGEDFQSAVTNAEDYIKLIANPEDQAIIKEQVKYLKSSLNPKSALTEKAEEAATKANLKAEAEGKSASSIVAEQDNRPVVLKSTVSPEQEKLTALLGTARSPKYSQAKDKVLKGQLEGKDLAIDDVKFIQQQSPTSGAMNPVTPDPYKSAVIVKQTIPSSEKLSAKVMDEFPITADINSQSLAELDATMGGLQNKIDMSTGKVRENYIRLYSDLKAKRDGLLKEVAPDKLNTYENLSDVFRAQKAAGLQKFGEIGQDQYKDEAIKLTKFLAKPSSADYQTKKLVKERLSSIGDVSKEFDEAQRYQNIADYMYDISAEKSAASGPGKTRKFANVAVQAVPVAIKRMENLLLKSPERLKAAVPEFAPVIDALTTATPQKRNALLFSLTSNPGFRAKAQPVIDEDDQDGQ